VPLQNDVPADPPGLRPTVRYNDHPRIRPQMLGFFEGLKAEDPGGRYRRLTRPNLSRP
jgi:hypothetical protein